eukprot:scaffold25845_cov112-Isochrysis_galbana.AAC.1
MGARPPKPLQHKWQVKARWVQLAEGWLVFRQDGGGKAERFTIGQHECCADAARRAYGIPNGTWLKLMAAARKAPSAGKDEEAMRQWDKEANVHRGRERTTAQSEAVDWWLDLDLMLWWEAVRPIEAAGPCA